MVCINNLNYIEMLCVGVVGFCIPIDLFTNFVLLDENGEQRVIGSFFRNR